MIAAGAHEPVLLNEVLSLLQPAPGKRFVDGTYGCGGHAEALLAGGAEVLGYDLDAAAVAACRAVASRRPGLRCRHGSYRDLVAGLTEVGWGVADGVLLDLGVSSPQIDDPERGFTYRADAELDLRFDRARGEPAHELLARLDEPALAELIRVWGEERGARRIAAAIVATRDRAPLRTTGDLRAVVESAVANGPHRPAVLSRVFQAFRIAVNDELGALGAALEAMPSALAPGGVLVVIAYHSLEDRAVKRWLTRESRDCICPPQLPICRCAHRHTVRALTARAVRPREEEIRRNPRARSARLRAAQRCSASSSREGMPVC